MIEIKENTRISDFFNVKFCAYAGYDTSRKLANYVDGLKISQRKSIWVVLNNTAFKRIKVSQLAADVARETNYVHGEGSMQSVITNLAKNYVGSNNINLLKPDGKFGTRFDEEPSAPRYIFVLKEPVLDKIFNKDELAITDPQYFEGDLVEPHFLLPTIPLILVNGSSGVGTGFKQEILPRNPKEIICIVQDILRGHGDKHEGKKITPWYRGFRGKIEFDSESGSWRISGIARYQNSTTIIIDELPIGYDLSGYNEVLEDLKDRGKIRGYTDLSDNDIFKFEVKVSRDTMEMSPEELLDYLKLTKKVTEIFVCIDENQRVIEFNNEFDILKAFVRVKLQYIEKRKNYVLAKYKRTLRIIKNKLKFIKAINEDIINIKAATKDVVKQLEELEFDKVDDSYAYLLDLKIHTLTEDKYMELREQFKKIYDMYKKLEASSCEDIFLEDLIAFEEGK